MAVPCGEKQADAEHKACDSWVFLHVPEKEAAWGPNKNEWCWDYLDKLGWTRVVNDANKRFICPNCSKKEVRIE